MDQEKGASLKKSFKNLIVLFNNFLLNGRVDGTNNNYSCSTLILYLCEFIGESLKMIKTRRSMSTQALVNKVSWQHMAKYCDENGILKFADFSVYYFIDSTKSA